MKAFALVGALIAAKIDLLNLKSHWTGNGVSHFAHGALRLLSNRLERQSGQISSYLPLPGGMSWTFKGTLTLRCADKANAGLALVFSSNNLIKPQNEYSYADNADAFGVAGLVTGISVVLHRDNIHVAFLERAPVTREQMLEWAVLCKAGMRAGDDDVTIIVRYREATLSIYIFDRVSSTETMCTQFKAIDFLEEFYLTAAGADANGKCAGTLTKTELDASITPEFIPEAYKQPQTPEFATFADFTPRDADVQHLHRAFTLSRQNAKILVNELLSFADKNEKEVEADLTADYSNYLGNLTAAAQAIEREAEHITLLSTALLAERESQQNDANELLSRILNWIESVEGVYDATAAATRNAHQIVTELALDTQLGRVLNETQTLLSKLKEAVANATQELTPPPNLSLHESDIIEWQRKVGGFATKFNATVQEAINARAVGGVQHLGAFVLVALAVTIFLAFGFLYWKVSKVAEVKRVL